MPALEVELFADDKAQTPRIRCLLKEWLGGFLEASMAGSKNHGCHLGMGQN